MQAQAETRQRLLDAAATTFARKGYTAAKLDEIAEAAGYSVGAVYSNFASKEQLFSELMAERAADRVGAVAEVLRSARPDQPGGAFGELGRLLIDGADKNIEVAALQTEFWLHAIRNPDTMGILAESTRGTLDLLLDVVTRLLEEHRVDQSIVSAEAFAVVVLALYQGLTRQRRTDPSRVSEDLFGQALSWQLAGMPKLRD
ncbi:TetR family transcriptional regulator [Mycolicibacterium litorale]|nr:TetR family transcriptional regulator [Mycolicibacterium litorale]